MEECWEHDLMKDLAALEDIDYESVFTISCKEKEMAKSHPVSVGDIEGTKTLAFIDTGATVNVMDLLRSTHGQL